MSADPVRALLARGVDKAAFAVAFAVKLRTYGAAAGLTHVEDFVRALTASPPDSRTALYWTARVSLVRSHAELADFDRVFAAVFDDAVLEMDPNARRDTLGGAPVDADDDGRSLPAPAAEGGSGLPWTTLPQAVAPAAADGEGTFTVPERLPSDVAGLAEAPFEQLSARETALLGRWLEAAARDWPRRRSRRRTSGRNGTRIALRPTVARARRTAWEPVELVRSRAVETPRPVVMLCDVSQSMQAQATAYLHLMRVLALTSRAEVFAFATSLTRLTTVLAHRSVDVAIQEATDRVTDRFGGTRIATCLRTLLASHRGGHLRGAIVLVGSDGWDGDPPDQLASAMAWLRRRAHRVVWMNPRASAPGFEPSVASMAAALPYCDALLPADTFGSLARVITTISGYRSRPGRSSSTRSRGSRAGTAPP